MDFVFVIKKKDVILSTFLVLEFVGGTKRCAGCRSLEL